VSFGLLREEERGYTLIGEGVLDLVHAATLDVEMDDCDDEERDFYSSIPRDQLATPWNQEIAHRIYYRLWNDEFQARMTFRVGGAEAGATPTAASLDGDNARWVVTRART
jgi:hypothetical protein